MSSLPPKITRLAANWSTSRENQLIQCIIAHDTERSSDSENSIKYLQRGGSLSDGSDRKVSIHTLIEPNGDHYEMVHDSLAANHAGYGTLTLNGKTYSKDARYNVNQISLGFELEYTKAPYNKPYPEPQLLSMGWWIRQKRLLYGNIPVLRHADVDPKRRSDTRNISVEEIEHWVTKADTVTYSVPTSDRPLAYRMLVSQVVYTDRSLSSPFAGGMVPVVLLSGVTVMIGDITGDWAWLVSGAGFIPKNTLTKVL